MVPPVTVAIPAVPSTGLCPMSALSLCELEWEGPKGSQSVPWAYISPLCLGWKLIPLPRDARAGLPVSWQQVPKNRSP